MNAPQPPEAPPTPRGPSHLHAALIGSVPALSPPARSCGPVRGSARSSVVGMLNQTVIICLYLPPPSPRPPPQLPFSHPHPAPPFLPQIETAPLSVAPLPVLPGLRWQSFKDHTSRTHAGLPECVSIHTWEEDYTSPPRQP